MEHSLSEVVAERGAGSSSALAALAAWAGAATSAALIGGLVLWGWQLAVRDVSEVPVIRAAAEPMRVAPESPGGERTPHQGLTVNRVAEDAPTEPPLRVALAPDAADLAVEDVAPAEIAADAEPAPAPPPRIAPTDLAVAEALGLSSDAMLIMASARTSDIPDTAPETDASRPRPAPRPFVAVSAAPALEIDPQGLAAGTRLVQLGAFETADEARAAWSRIADRFGGYLAGKDRIVQPAETAGRAFWRLRAAGFADLADARRFCAALNARDADCIPVVVR